MGGAFTPTLASPKSLVYLQFRQEVILTAGPSQKPSCTFCTNLKIECIYRKITPEPRSRITRSPRARDRRIQGPISPEDDSLSGRSHDSFQAEQSPRLSSSNFIKPPLSPSGESHHNFVGSANLLVLPALREPHGNYAVPPSYDVPKTHEIHLPELKNCNCLAPLNELVYDDMADYLQREILQGDEFFDYVPTIEVDLSPRTCWGLQQSFAVNILPWLPLFQADDSVRHLEDATIHNFNPRNTSSTLTLFVLAVGAIINRPNDTEDAVDCLAGMEYFYKGCRSLEGYNRKRSSNIEIIQCRILSSYVLQPMSLQGANLSVSIYLCICLRPLQAWYAISEASNAVMILLKMEKKMAGDANFIQSLRRAYWCCYIIEA